MEKLDELVLNAFRQKIYTPEYIKAILEKFRAHLDKAAPELKQLASKLKTELKEAELAESNPVNLIDIWAASGLVDT